MTDIQKHMLRMFIAIRIGVGVVGIALPVVLGDVGYFGFHIPLAGSMSAYYHATRECSGLPAVHAQDVAGTPQQQPPSDPCSAIGTGPMRNWFVGCLFFFGGAMFLMRGFSVWENVALNIAGVMAPCIALFPMNWGPQAGFTPHMIFAITFFVCIGFTCVFCSEKTLKEMPGIPDRDKIIARYRRVYQVLGILMIVLPVGAHLFFHEDPHRMFLVETAGVWAFGAYWLVKTSELRRSEVEIRALTGRLPLNPRTLR